MAQGMAEATQTSEGPMSAGTTVEVTADIFGRHTMKLVITEFEPNKRLRGGSTRALSQALLAMASCTFESVEGGT